MLMCHMFADSDAELHDMAARIGVARRHHQAPPAHDSHYDICLSKRREAVTAGAGEVSRRQAAAMLARRRATGALGDPQDALSWFRTRPVGRLGCELDREDP